MMNITAADGEARQIELASRFTIAHYIDALEHCKQEVIADAVHRRFLERYVCPVAETSNTRHGFTMMAVGCLMIEALESFRRGWADTRQRGLGELAFCSFFDRHELFAPFRGHAQDFYRGVRCGILHQAETTLGWRIRRDGDLLDVRGAIRTINATVFIQRLHCALDAYRDELKAAAWSEEIWVLCRKKMERICANCMGPEAHS